MPLAELLRRIRWEEFHVREGNNTKIDSEINPLRMKELSEHWRKFSIWGPLYPFNILNFLIVWKTGIVTSAINVEWAAHSLVHPQTISRSLNHCLALKAAIRIWWHCHVCLRYYNNKKPTSNNQHFFSPSVIIGHHCTCDTTALWVCTAIIIIITMLLSSVSSTKQKR